jgi:hypothetical protein
MGHPPILADVDSRQPTGSAHSGAPGKRCCVGSGFDVDLRELQGQERLDAFCDFLRAIGRRLGKPVLMDPEGGYGHPVLGFDVEADRVVLLAESLVT